MLGFNYLLVQLSKLRERFIYIYLFIVKDIYVRKGADEQPNEEVHRMMFRRVLSAGSSVPGDLKGATLLAGRCVYHARNLQNSTLLGFL